MPGARWREDEALIETVVHLTEWPTVVLGNFETEYLALPEEVLVTVMRDHQKYFAVEDADGKLAPHFLAVLNTRWTTRARRSSVTAMRAYCGPGSRMRGSSGTSTRRRRWPSVSRA